ncbi:hypothetical protein C3U77_000152 [Escherichia coli]|nr:hypothetical protein [Escherichia coli]EFA7760400.1 hypothetical protein [Escherichia coli]EFA7784741.1 hypothetical protein [Escherichia coli]EFA7789017.1 hypothetical protein [Escherichia coli]EFA7796225.1 hypothetical protein [Escherichia coli]
MQQINHNNGNKHNGKFICLLTEDGEDRLQETMNIVSLFCGCTDYNDNHTTITNKQLFSFLEVIWRNIDFVLSESFYPDKLLTKEKIIQEQSE